MGLSAAEARDDAALDGTAAGCDWLRKESGLQLRADDAKPVRLDHGQPRALTTAAGLAEALVLLAALRARVAGRVTPLPRLVRGAATAVLTARSAVE